MVTSPMEFLRQQQESKLAAAEPLIMEAQAVEQHEAQLADARKRYSAEWKKLTTGKGAKWTEAELVASGLGRPVSVPAARASSSRSKKPEGKPEPAAGPPATPSGE
jgi:hypothetical protein